MKQIKDNMKKRWMTIHKKCEEMNDNKTDMVKKKDSTQEMMKNINMVKQEMMEEINNSKKNMVLQMDAMQLGLSNLECLVKDALQPKQKYFSFNFLEDLLDFIFYVGCT